MIHPENKQRIRVSDLTKEDWLAKYGDNHLCTFCDEVKLDPASKEIGPLPEYVHFGFNQTVLFFKEVQGALHVSQWIKGVFADQQIVEIEEAKDSPNSKIVSFFPINAAAGAGPSLKLEVICEKIGQNSSNDPQTLTILA